MSRHVSSAVFLALYYSVLALKTVGVTPALTYARSMSIQALMMRQKALGLASLAALAGTISKYPVCGCLQSVLDA